MRERKQGADLWGAMVLAVAFLVLLSPHYAWYFAWLVPFLCFYPSAALIYLTCIGQLALHRTLAAAPLGRTAHLRRVRPGPGSRALDPTLSQKGGASWRRCRRLEVRWTAPLFRERRHEQPRADRAERLPVCVYLETTNRCNLLCTTCPRTYEELEPPADMSWELFTSIVDQIPDLERAVLHGVGEPMLVKSLPRMVRYLKDRGTYVLFNTNGTVLNEKNGRALIDAGLDELRVSLDAANAKSYLAVRGKNYFGRILKNVRAFRDLQEREGKERPRVSAWLTGLRETVAELPAFVQVAADIGVKEVYLQRLVFFDQRRHRPRPAGPGALRADDARRAGLYRGGDRAGAQPTA